MADVTYTRVYPEEVITLVNKLIALLQSEYSLSICEYKKIFHYLAIHLLADKSKILMLNPAITSFFPQQEVSKIAHLCYSTAYKLSEEFMYHILIWLYLNGKLEEMKYVDNSDNTIKSLNERFIKDFEEHFTSSLRYIIDNKELLDKQENHYSSELLNKVLEDTNNNGIKINGVYLSGTPKAITTFGSKENIAHIDVQSTEIYSDTFSDN